MLGSKKERQRQNVYDRTRNDQGENEVTVFLRSISGLVQIFFKRWCNHTDSQAKNVVQDLLAAWWARGKDKVYIFKRRYVWQYHVWPVCRRAPKAARIKRRRNTKFECRCKGSGVHCRSKSGSWVQPEYKKKWRNAGRVTAHEVLCTEVCLFAAE